MDYDIDTPLSPEAQSFLERLRPKIRSSLLEIQRIPVSVLLWGPSPDKACPIANMRKTLRSELRGKGHAAFFSEELCDPLSDFSLRIQQLIQAQNFDLVVSLPSSPGSVAEVHDFASDSRVNAKMLVLLNENSISGYGAQSLQAISSILSCQIFTYPSEEHIDCVKDRVFSEVQRIREIKYLLFGGRNLGIETL